MIKTFRTDNNIASATFVKFANDGTITNTSSSSDVIIGIAGTNWGNMDGVADVYLAGEVTKIEAGGAFNAGDALTSDANGKAVKATGSVNVGAIALEGASASGDYVEVIVNLANTIPAEVSEPSAEPSSEPSAETSEEPSPEPSV